MKMDKHRLEQLIAKGEGIDLEFKACGNQLPKSVYETVCAFLNRHEGTLLLGVADDGTVSGILKRWSGFARTSSPLSTIPRN